MNLFNSNVYTPLGGSSYPAEKVLMGPFDSIWHNPGSNTVIIIILQFIIEYAV